MRNINELLIKKKVRNIFIELENHGIEYCLLKGWEKNNITIAKEDVDVVLFLKEKEDINYIYQIFRKKQKEIKKIPYTLSFIFIDKKEKIHFHFHFNSLRIHSFSFLRKEDMLKRRDKYYGIFIPQKSLYFAILILSWLFSKGVSYSIKYNKYNEKKLSQFKDVWDMMTSNKSRNDAIFLLKKIIGERSTYKIIDYIVAEKWDRIFEIVPQIKKRTFGYLYFFYYLKEKVRLYMNILGKGL